MSASEVELVETPLDNVPGVSIIDLCHCLLLLCV